MKNELPSNVSRNGRFTTSGARTRILHRLRVCGPWPNRALYCTDESMSRRASRYNSLSMRILRATPMPSTSKSRPFRPIHTATTQRSGVRHSTSHNPPKKHAGDSSRPGMRTGSISIIIKRIDGADGRGRFGESPTRSAIAHGMYGALSDETILQKYRYRHGPTRCFPRCPIRVRRADDRTSSNSG